MTYQSPRPIRAVPITLLTGFLGAGKTSLLNTILRGNHGLRIAVLVNDFGAINIDADLIASVHDDTIRLTNGCVCCAIRGDLLAAVLALLARPEPPEYIVLECSGVADPVAVARTFVLPQLRSRILLDSTITVVDAEQVHAHDEHQELISDQIAAADIVVLNKIDLASDNLRAGLRRWIDMIAPGARIIETTHGRAPLELILGVGAYGRVFERAEAAHMHDTAFATWSYVADRPFGLHALRRALDSLPIGVVRAKGVLWVAEQPLRQVVLQSVGRRVSMAPDAAWGDMPRSSRMVLIGTPGSVDADRLAALFDACLVTVRLQ